MLRAFAKFQNFRVFWLLLWIATSQKSGALPDFQIDVWQTDEGLPQSTVTSIVQTRDGYLWLGTQNGLVRFDGAQFRVFNQNNTPAIRNDRMAQLFEDRQGKLWISGEHGEILCLQNGQFRAYALPGKGTPFNYARRIFDDAEGNLWVISCEWQLIRLGKDGFTVPSTNWNLEGSQPSSGTTDQLGRFWVNTEKELAVWQRTRFQSVWSEANEGNFHVDLAPSRTGGVWVAANGRVRKFESGRWVADLGAFAWGSWPIYDLYEDSHNCLWVATMGNGLFRYGTNGAVLHLGKKDGLPTDFVRCALEDREGNIWVGMESGGLCRLRPVTFKSLGARQGLSSDQVTSVCESADGSFWIAMDGEGLDHLLSDGEVAHYGPSRGMRNGHVWSVLEDRQAKVWAGTWMGLFRRRADGFADLADGMGIGLPIFAMYEDRQGGLWLGQQGCGVLTRLLGEQQTLTQIPGTASSLDVRVVVEDAAGNLWVGTQSEGLFGRLNGQWTHYGKKEGLASDTVWSLRPDPDGTLWIGTCGGGLSRLQSGSISTWTTKNGLVNDVICQILEDRQNHLWLGSYGGVFRVDKRQLSSGANRSNAVECVSYDKTDGLPSLECVGGFQPSGLCSHDGRLWFPTVKGFAIVDPEKVPFNPLAPLVLIEGVEVGGAALLPKGEVIGCDSPERRLAVPPGKRHLEFQYAAPSLANPSKVRFKYKLEGLETSWNDAGARRAADYTYVPPGQYRFHVVACNNDGVWNSQGVSLAVTVLPYFWQTGWFAAVVILAALGSVAGSVRYAVRRKMQRKLELVERERAIEAERARIANDIHDDLGAGLTEIVILSELAQNPEGADGAALADIRRVTDKARALAHSLDEIVWAVNPENDVLDNFVSYACSFVHDYLQMAKIRCRLAVPAYLPEVPLTANIRHNLFMVLKEALNNIVKHANASEVWIQIAVEAEKFTLSVRDNGRGFQPEPEADSAAENLSRAPRRNGLANMRKRMRAIGGAIRVQSLSGQGTRVELTVPLRGRSIQAN